ARRIIDVAAHREVVVEGVVHLAIDFEEADVLLENVAVDQEVELAFGAQRIAGGVNGSPELAGSTRIDVTPGADVEGELANRQASTAVSVDFSRGAVREGDAGAAQADIELEVLGD